MPLNLPALPAGLWRVMLGTTLVVSSYSLLNPVLAVRLQTAGASNLAVGLGNAPWSSDVEAALWARRAYPSALVREHVVWALAEQHQKRAARIATQG